MPATNNSIEDSLISPLTITINLYLPLKRSSTFFNTNVAGSSIATAGKLLLDIMGALVRNFAASSSSFEPVLLLVKYHARVALEGSPTNVQIILSVDPGRTTIILLLDRG